METLTGLISSEVLAVLLGGSGLLGILSFVNSWKSNKKIKEAEAAEKDLKNLNIVVESLKENILYMNGELSKLRTTIALRDATIDKLYMDQFENSVKYAQKKGAISQAYGCTFQKTCPVLERLKNYDEQNLKRKEKDIDSNSNNTNIKTEDIDA